MAAQLNLHWTPIAIAHLHAAYDYVAEDSVAAAESLLDRIFTAAEAATRFPQIGRQGRVAGTRELVIAGTPFVVAYRPRRNQIDVLAVFHGARRWPEEF
jgi:toxin ParE1/3/4